MEQLKTTSSQKRKEKASQSSEQRQVLDVSDKHELLVINTVDNFEGGKLKYFRNHWEKVTSDAFIIQTIKGYRLELDDIPKQTFRPKPIIFSDRDTNLINLEIEKFLDKRIICPVPYPEFNEYYSNIFITPKKDNSIRVILNLKSFNDSVSKIHFKMDTLTTALANIQRNDYFASIDLKDSYYSVPVHTNDQKYLRFLWNNNAYQFCVLPQGLSTSPRVFTKILKPVYSELRKLGYINIPYIDDSLLIGRTYEECYNNIHETVKLVDQLGFTIHPIKSVFIPTQEIIFLGFVLNSVDMSVKLTPERKTDLKNLCLEVLALPELSIRQLAKLIGKMVASEPGVQYAALYYKDLEIFKDKMLKQNKGNFEAKILLPNELKADIQWWIKTIPNSRKLLSYDDPHVILFSDASKTGWGGYNQSNGDKTEGFWLSEEKLLHINYLELKAAFLTLQSLVGSVKHQHIRLNMDNTVAISYINNFGGRIPNLHKLAKQIWHWCIDRNLWISVAHIAGKQNIEADKLSRNLNDDMEWTLIPEVFSKLEVLLGQIDIDLFASRINHQVSKYVTYNPDPHAVAINAFMLNWNEHCTYYIFPPFSVIGRVLQKIVKDKVQLAILVAPIWPTQVWFAQILHQICQQSYILPKKCLYLPQDPSRVHPISNLRLGAFILSGNICKIQDFQKTLPTLFYSLGEHQQESSIGLISKSGCFFQVNNKKIHLTHI